MDYCAYYTGMCDCCWSDCFRNYWISYQHFKSPKEFDFDDNELLLAKWNCLGNCFTDFGNINSYFETNESFHSCFVVARMPEDRGLFLLAVADLRLLLFIILMHQLVYFMTGLENSNSFASFHYFSFIMFYSKAES